MCVVIHDDGAKGASLKKIKGKGICLFSWFFQSFNDMTMLFCRRAHHLLLCTGPRMNRRELRRLVRKIERGSDIACHFYQEEQFTSIAYVFCILVLISSLQRNQF